MLTTETNHKDYTMKNNSREFVGMDGNEAVGHVAYRTNGAIAI